MFEWQSCEQVITEGFKNAFGVWCSMDVQEKLTLIKRNTAEIITEKELKTLLQEKKQPAVYLGTAITGRPHVGYFAWVLKLADFLKAGFTVKLLLADLHGALDGTPWDVLEKRYAYYARALPLMFDAIGMDKSQLDIVKGSDFQLDTKYFYDVLQFSTKVNIKDCVKASSEVVKSGVNPRLSGAIYPIMQSLDEEYLQVDVQYGGTDQRNIMVFARENLPKLGYKPRIEVMTPLIPGLIGKKMSASDPRSKIDLLDDEKIVESKIKSAFVEEGKVKDNGLLAFLHYVVMVMKQDKGEQFTVDRPEKFGGALSFATYEDVEKAFKKKTLHPQDLKKAITREINQLLAPFRADKKVKDLAKAAYS